MRATRFRGEYTVWFSRLHIAVPVFHRMLFGVGTREYILDDGGTRREHTTACGEVTWWSTHDAKGNFIDIGDSGTHLPARHAVKFGRPCRKCFPGE